MHGGVLVGDQARGAGFSPALAGRKQMRHSALIRTRRRISFKLLAAREVASMSAAPLTLDNSYARDLQGFSVPWRPQAAPSPKSLFFNEALAHELGLDVAALSGEPGAALFAGNAVPEGAEPIAQAYAGHQFGGFSPQIGRASCRERV